MTYAMNVASIHEHSRDRVRRHLLAFNVPDEDPTHWEGDGETSLLLLLAQLIGFDRTEGHTECDKIGTKED